MRNSFAKRADKPNVLTFPQAHGRSFDHALARLLNGLSPIRINYQAIVDLRRGVIAGYEATPRFPAALGSSTEACFEAAKVLDKDIELEEMFIRKGLEGRAMLPANCFLSINVRPPFLVSTQFEEMLAGLSDLSAVVIEIAMGEATPDYGAVKHVVSKIRAVNGFVALDHAGSAYSTLQHILEIRPQFIKLDRDLTERCDCNQAKSVLIEMMGQAANRLDAWVVAEGVETPQELSELVYLKLPLGQGRYLGRPHLFMQPLAEKRAAEIRSKIRTEDSPKRLNSYVEVSPVQPTLEAAQLILANSLSRIVVIADSSGRPTHLLERHPLIGNRILRDFMKAQISSNPVEVLLRALTRPIATRSDPIAVINNRGLLQGVIHIDNLTRRVVDGNSARN